jgi:alpha-amylase/alpha-mannosidase (GH57 family)
LDRAVCVHGHFYQPPREHPWLEQVEQQDSAYPFHDWNERITAECYGPNTHARILDEDGRIRAISDNYSRMSFNIGPTLLAWMEEAAPAVHDAIVAADAAGARRFGGHGSAMAQVYNHVIMPLASERDRVTQVVWGIADFRHRFGRDPEGMWLAECAADTPTLEVLAAHGIRFTVLSPYQAAEVRERPDAEWQDASGGRVDPTQPYRVVLPSGADIAVFFYDGPISRAVAFEGLLDSGDRFASRILDGFADRAGPQLAHIATDGESYGHHHRHGEMALAATLAALEARDDVTLTNYAQFLATHPPAAEARIVEQSSWSCAHGVERWRADCGCGGGGGSTQAWRAPLRAGLDELATALATIYEREATGLLRDPWAARDAYVEVVLDRARRDAFLDAHLLGTPTDDERRRALRLLELQRHSLLMFTSCGWFFDELSRIETTQVLRYAARAIQLATQVSDDADGLEDALVAHLAVAPSNVPRFRDGATIWRQLIRPQVVGLEQVAAHVAIAVLFSPEEHRRGRYRVERREHRVATAGRARLATGRADIASTATGSTRSFEYGVLHLGDHNVTCGIRLLGDDDRFLATRVELDRHFETADFPALVRAIDDHFDRQTHSLGSLFADERRRILDTIVASTVEETEATYRNTFRSRAPLMRYLADLHVPLPAPLLGAAQVVINADLRRELASAAVDPTVVEDLVGEATRFGVSLDDEGLAHTLGATVARTAERIATLATDRAVFAAFDEAEEQLTGRLAAIVEVAGSLPFEVDLAAAQDVLWRVLRDHHADLAVRATAGDEAATRWRDELAALAEALHVRVPTPSG